MDIDQTEGVATEDSLSQTFGNLGKRIGTNTLAAITDDGTFAALALLLTRQCCTRHPLSEDPYFNLKSNIIGYTSAKLCHEKLFGL